MEKKKMMEGGEGRNQGGEGEEKEEMKVEKK